MGFLRQYRGALLVISHDLDLLDEAITRVLHLDRPTRPRSARSSSTRAPTASTIAARAEDEERLAKLAAQQAQGDRPACRRFVDRFGAKATKASMAHSMEKRIARLEAERGRRPEAATAGDHVRFPDPPPCGHDRARGARTWQGVRRPARVRGRRLRPRPRRAAARARPQRRRQDEPAAHPRRRDRRPTSATFEFGHNVVRRLLRPGARQPRSGQSRARQHPRRRAARRRCSPRPSCAGCSACSGCRARRCSRTPARCRAARRRSWRWRC